MALYSAKEAKWYRRNVERREHHYNLTPPPALIESFFRFFSVLPGLRSLIGPFDRHIRKSSNFFSSTAPPTRSPSSIDSLPKVRFNCITCCSSCQATRGYVYIRARGAGCAYRDHRQVLSRSRGTIEHLVKVVGPGTAFEC